MKNATYAQGRGWGTLSGPACGDRITMKTEATTQPPAAGEAAHTPTPWLVNEDPRRLAWTIKPVNFPGASVGEVHGQSIAELQANAAFIVRACNAYDSDQRKIAHFVSLLREARDAARDERPGVVGIPMELWDRIAVATDREDTLALSKETTK